MFLACSFLVLLVALARASCPGAAAGCALLGTRSVTDLGDTIHGVSVGSYLLVFAVATISAGVALLRRRRFGPGVVLLVLAVLSVLASGRLDEASPGAELRVWLAVNALALLAVVAFGAGAAESNGARGRRSSQGLG